MPTVTWRLVNGPGFVREGISFLERAGASGVSHAELIFGNESFGSRSPEGVKYRPLDTYAVDKRFSAEVSAEKYAAGLAFLAAQNGKGYDYLADAGIAADRNWRSEDRWQCAELLTAALEKFGIVQEIDCAINMITPQDALIYSSALLGLPK